MPGLFDDLDELQPPSAKAKAKEATKPTFPCQSCGGTGIYQNPRVHQPKAHCFACNGKGFFKTSPFDRAKKKAAKVEREATKLQNAKDAMEQQYPGFEVVLREFAVWSDIGRDMLDKYSKKGTLSDGQVQAVYRMMAKAAENKAKRDAERNAAQAARTAEVDLSPIHAMFDSAKASGLKKLKYRAEGLVVSPASEFGANKGALYVKTVDGEYIGKIVGTKFFGNRDSKPEQIERLHTIAADPIEAAKAYGKFTNTCSCCGRQLTDPVSVEMGIGPVCAEKWFGIVLMTPERGILAKENKAATKAALNQAAAQGNEVAPQLTKTPSAKYDYPEGMTDAQKKAYRAKMRRQR